MCLYLSSSSSSSRIRSDSKPHKYTVEDQRVWRPHFSRAAEVHAAAGTYVESEMLRCDSSLYYRQHHKINVGCIAAKAGGDSKKKTGCTQRSLLPARLSSSCGEKRADRSSSTARTAHACMNIPQRPALSMKPLPILRLHAHQLLIVSYHIHSRHRGSR